MCFLCAISRWSRRLASMLPWLVFPFVFVWALSQILPPSYRLEVTSSRLACLIVLSMSLVWYEFLMPWLCKWRVHRSALLKERKLIEALEAAKWRKEATRRCRNCLTAYKTQMPGSGKYVCTYCGHISKRPVLEVPGALANSKLNAAGSLLVGNGAGMLHVKGECHGVGPISAWSTTAERNRCDCYGESLHRTEKCSLGQSFQAAFLLVTRILSLLWQKLLGIGQSNTDGPGESNRMTDYTDDLSRIRSDKARRKADKKKQARLQKEKLEAEDRKQREEVALLVEERRRQRDEREVAKQKERESDTEREREARRKRDNEKQMEKTGRRLMLRPVTDGPTDQGQEHVGAIRKSIGEVGVRLATPMGAKEQLGESITSTIATAKLSRGTLQDHASRYRSTISSFSRLGLLKGPGSRLQKEPGSAFRTGVISQVDGTLRGKKEAALAVGHSSIPTGSSSSSPNGAGAPQGPVSAWKRAPWIGAWVRGSKGITAGNSSTQGETAIGGGERLEPNFGGDPKSSINYPFIRKPSSSLVRGTAIQPPIAPPSIHVDPLQQLFSAPSLFSPMNLKENMNTQFERKPQNEVKPVFLPEHTFFEAQSYSQSLDPFALLSTLPPVQMPMPVLDTLSISSQPTVARGSIFVQSNESVPQGSVLSETLYGDLGATLKSPPSNPADLNVNDSPSSLLGTLKVSELDLHGNKEDFLVWDNADELALQLAPLSTVQSLFDSETLIPDVCLLSPQKMGSPKANEDVGVNRLPDSDKHSFSSGFDTAVHIWDDAHGSQKVPAEFVDCITQEIMEDPVITADGHSYERDAIEKWLKHHDTSPKTGEILPPPPGSIGVDKTLRPNHILRGQIMEYNERLTQMSELRSMTWNISSKDTGFFKMTSSPSVLSF